MLHSPVDAEKDQKHRFVLTNPLPKHFIQIQDLCRRVYPFTKPWSIEQLESHRANFPDGQLIVIDNETEKVVGLAFSLIISWSDYSPQDNWQDFTSGGFFHNHNPRQGKTLYGAEVMVDPEYRGRGIGKLLYAGRQDIVHKYNLKRIRAGARLRGYSKFKDKLSPREYVKQVTEKKIYDPTLSFQLGQGFKVIDVAANYLFNDPESLGYAAVIEWLNPENNSARDFEKQRQSLEFFLSGDQFVPQYLPKELRNLVRRSTTALGRAIIDLEGEAFYRKIEHYREQLKKSRNKEKIKQVLQALSKKLNSESKQDLLKIAHAFSLQLEIVNVCEAAYRTWRQRQKPLFQGLKNKLNLTYVLTAHPTEARSKDVVESLNRLQKMLVEEIQNKFIFNEKALATQMRLLWLQSLVKNERPTVIDEAEYIYSLTLNPEILDFLLQEKPAYDLKLRTWVGGDKDGHPGVDKNTMKECLVHSRQYLIHYASLKLSQLLSDLVLLGNSKKLVQSELSTLRKFLIELKYFKVISTGDGTKIKTWSFKYKTFIKRASKLIRDHEQTLLLLRFLDYFPAFVLPIELREDASLISEALKDTKAPIREMLTELSKISGALDITSYARGLIISHCEQEQDLANACQLVDLVCKQSSLPVIPLFETREALLRGKRTLKKWLSIKRNHDRVQRHWFRKFEIMLGYSDSAKQTGTLASRLLISKSMREIDKTLRPFQIQPIFFHGSGGSVARGGGSLKEQISWWSRSAIENPKMTIQGEMIQRIFASKEILNSQCIHLTTEAQRRKVRKVRFEKSPELDSFADQVANEYTKLINNSELLSVLLNATPYKYLDILKIGSRPSKRPTANITLSSLRAIPWVLCWTQTRVLLPIWWGIGTTWTNLNLTEKEKLKTLYLKNPFFSSFIKTLGFTLAKVELDVWELYLNEKENAETIKVIRREFDDAVKFVLEASQEKDLIWYRPWLAESIRLRSPHIHLLNLIQIIAMKKSDENLLRETIVGIACGMLTTG